MIKLNNLNKYFNAGKKNEIHVLNDITLSLPDKGLVMFLGASGSGKTTLLNVIGGLDKIKRGSIYFEEEEISKFNISKWDELRNESIGYIFQNYYLQPQLSVFDNVAFVLKMIGITDAEEINTRVSYILKALGMYEYRKKKALQLSGGQQQRVAIARALVKNPSIIIADEPTGNLDSKNTADIMNIIQAIAKEKLVVLVTHEKELAQFYADRIIEISDGKITSDVLNTQSLHHGLVDEQTIYLKDLTNETTLESSKLDVNFYSDKEIDHKIKVDVIFKNNTLYLKVDSNYKNIKLTNDQEGIEIKNEHFVKKSREQLLETTYDTNFLDHKHIKKERKFVISAKRNVKIALGKILSFGRKGKLMIASFVLAGTVIAFALSMLFTALVINPVTPYEKDTLRIETNLPISNNATYSQFKEIVGNDKFIFHTSASLTLDIAGFGNNELRKSGNIIINETSTAKIKYGRDIRSNNEVLISIGLANDFINRESGFLGSMSISGNDFGLWEYSDLFNEDFSLTMASNSPTKIVGIKDNNEKAIYINEALYLEHLNMNGNQTLESAYENATTIIIFSTNKNNVVNNLTNTNIVDMYQQAYDNSKENNTSLLPTLLPIVSLFLGFTFIGFYFVIRSSMISRIQEIGIYRALGVKRIEIISMFFFEIVILTTISTLIGYFLGFLLVRSLASSLLGQLNMFATNGFSFVLGITLVYAFNILAGLLPVFLLLNKTPAQILTQYDI